MSSYVLIFESEVDIEDFRILYSQYSMTVNYKSVAIHNVDINDISEIIKTCHDIQINIISSIKIELGA